MTINMEENMERKKEENCTTVVTVFSTTKYGISELQKKSNKRRIRRRHVPRNHHVVCYDYYSFLQTNQYSSFEKSKTILPPLIYLHSQQSLFLEKALNYFRQTQQQKSTSLIPVTACPLPIIDLLTILDAEGKNFNWYVYLKLKAPLSRVYRFWDGIKAMPSGRYWAIDNYQLDPLHAREKLAVAQSWNKMTHLSVTTIPENTEIIIGPALAQQGCGGGGIQIYLWNDCVLQTMAEQARVVQLIQD